MDRPVGGNSFIYYLFFTGNLFLIAVGIGTMAAGIYVWAETHKIEWYNASFAGLGLMILLISIMGLQTRYSSPILFLYLLLIGCSLIGQAGFTIAIIVYKNFGELIPENAAYLVRYGLLGSCAIILYCLIIGWWYSGSLNSAQIYEIPMTTGNTALGNKEDNRKANISRYSEIKEKFFSEDR